MDPPWQVLELGTGNAESPGGLCPHHCTPPSASWGYPGCGPLCSACTHSSAQGTPVTVLPRSPLHPSVPPSRSIPVPPDPLFCASQPQTPGGLAGMQGSPQSPGCPSHLRTTTTPKDPSQGGMHVPGGVAPALSHPWPPEAQAGHSRCRAAPSSAPALRINQWLMLAQFFWAGLRLPSGDAIAIPLGHGSLSPALSPVPAEQVSSCKLPPKQISAGSGSANTEQWPKPPRRSGASSAPHRQPRGSRETSLCAWIRPRGKPFPFPKSHSKSFPAAGSSSAGDRAAAIFGLVRVRLGAGIAPWSPPAARPPSRRLLDAARGRGSSLSTRGLAQR